MSATDDALDATVTVCCWLDPGFCEWGEGAQRILAEAYCKNHKWVAAAERVVVELGLGLEYAHAIMLELIPSCRAGVGAIDYLTAPLDVRLRALARVVREQQTKETEA